MRIILIALLMLASQLAQAVSCREVAEKLNAALNPRVDAVELASVLSSLQQTGQLPDKFVTKRQAQQAGWQPGRNLWQTLPGKSIGGDYFGNREGRLPKSRYTEADLDYRGGKRGGKRIVFSRERRYVTVDHYQTFTEVPPCR
ncbi:ribonuclease [Formivibrio citricus]|uniref:Ribonuclease n=1 Tax=Formivibrio citricus TaxID=83765 RepID=A0A1I4YBA6_9NEIS|nr:ribonuclease domain-containing protein [Formivibrio citricus]SFN35351.1 ribonuclease [Formivibrio citricus]